MSLFIFSSFSSSYFSPSCLIDNLAVGSIFFQNIQKFEGIVPLLLTPSVVDEVYVCFVSNLWKLLGCSVFSFEFRNFTRILFFLSAHSTLLTMFLPLIASCYLFLGLLAAFILYVLSLFSRIFHVGRSALSWQVPLISPYSSPAWSLFLFFLTFSLTY